MEITGDPSNEKSYIMISGPEVPEVDTALALVSISSSFIS